MDDMHVLKAIFRLYGFVYSDTNQCQLNILMKRNMQPHLAIYEWIWVCILARYSKNVQLFMNYYFYEATLFVIKCLIFPHYRHKILKLKYFFLEQLKGDLLLLSKFIIWQKLRNYYSSEVIYFILQGYIP